MDSVPEYERQALKERLESHPQTAQSKRCAGVNVRFRGRYAYMVEFDNDPWFMPGSTTNKKEQIR